MPTYIDLMSQLISAGVHVVGRGMFDRRCSETSHWSAEFVDVVMAGRKVGCVMRKLHVDAPSEERLYRILVGYLDHTQARLVAQNIIAVDGYDEYWKANAYPDYQRNCRRATTHCVINNRDG